MQPKLDLTRTHVFRTVLVVVICLSFWKLVLCLWYNGPTNNSDVAEQEVHQWLDSLGLGQYKELFEKHGEWKGYILGHIILIQVGV